MPLDLQRIVGPTKVKGTPDDPLYVVVQGISLSNVQGTGSVSNVTDNTLTTIVTVTYTLGVFENISIVAVSGTEYAKFFLVLNGVTQDVRRSGPDRNVQFDFTGSPLRLSLGDVVDVKVEHFAVGVLADFDATVYGYAS